jgi:lysine 2,3-aminomutase
MTDIQVETSKPVGAVKPKRKNKRDKSARFDNLKSQIKESKFHRYIAHDIAGYERYLAEGGVTLYSKTEIEELKKAGVSNRLPPRATSHYMSLAMKSDGIRNLIKARPEETEDLSGEKDPSNQLKYSPVSGLLHKYELCLLYVVRTCSSWCRYCYRSDFLTSKTEKDIASVKEITDYIKSHNKMVAEQTKGKNRDSIFVEGKGERFPIREALLSGGDPMVLSNMNLFIYLDGLAEAGVRTIRIGTKELAFFPQRFDDNFFDMIDFFHELHPRVNLAFMVHFSHPDELLMKDDNGKYVMENEFHAKRIPVTETAIRRLRSRYFVTLENQTPIIDGVNDDSATLRRLQVEMKRVGINNHYFFQCREIEGHKIFAVPVEKAWKLHRDSQMGLSGIEKSRFCLSTEDGKLEVISVIDKPDFDALGLNIPADARKVVEAVFGEGLILFKSHRSPDTNFQGDLIIARRNPEALWITGYKDRIIYDGRKVGNDCFNPITAMLNSLFGGDITADNIDKVLKKAKA